MLSPTYKLDPNPPPPMDRDLYLQQANEQWCRLLNSNPDEVAVQTFLEHNPSFVPGANTPGSRSGHWPFPLAVISQPSLSGSFDRVPDFMWLAMDSCTWYPTFVEIEAPNKLLFTKSGTPTAMFSQARNQLAQWRTWINEPENQQILKARCGLPEYCNHRQMQPHFILVYGRRSEFEGNGMLTKLRASQMTASDEELISFDRLSADRGNDILTCVRMGSVPGRYRAIGVPPTFTVGANNADILSLVDNLEDAVNNEHRISKERRKFLCQRLPYWRCWHQSRRLGLISHPCQE